MADDVNKPKGVGPVNSGDTSRFETMADRDPLGSVHQRNVTNATSTAAFRKMEHRAENAQRLLEQQQEKAAELKQKIIEAQIEIQKQVNAQYEQRLREIAQDKGRNSPEYQMTNRARRAHVQAAINQSSQNMAGPGQEPTLLDRRIAYSEQVDSTIPKIANHVNKTMNDLAVAREEAGITAGNQTARFIDARSNQRAVASDVNSVKMSVRNIDEIRGNINLPTGALEMRSEQLNSRIQEIAEQKKSIAKSRDPGASDKLNELDAEERKVRFQLGINEGAKDEQRYQRVDDRSLMRVAREDQQKYRGTLEKMGYKDRVEDEKAKMGQQSGADAYEDAISGLKDALEKAAEAAKEFEENIHKASNETERQAMIDKKVAADSAVQGAQTKVDAAKSKVEDEASSSANVQKRLRAGARAANALADAAYYTGVTRYNEKDQLGTAYANVATEMYNDSMSVGRNQDIRAFRRLAEGYSHATGEGEDGRGWGTATAWLDAGGSAMNSVGDILGGLIPGGGSGAAGGAAGGAADGAGKSLGKGGAASKVKGAIKAIGKKLPGLNVVTAFSDGLPAAVQAGKSIDRAVDGRAGGTAAMSRYEAALANYNASNEIANTQMQSAMDYRRTVGMNMIGSGAAGGGMYDYMTNSANVTALGQAGLSKQETTNLMHQGAATLGRDFDIKDIQRAGEVRKAGVMDTSQYISALGSLQNAGGKSEDLENIMKNAISAGMDDAKSIMALVSGISEMASSRARVTGESNLNAFNNQAANVASSLDPNLSATIRTQMTMDAMQRVSAHSTDTSMNIPNYIEMGKIQKLNKDFNLNLSGSNLKNMLKMDLADTNEMELLSQDMNPENEKKIREYYKNSGVNLKGVKDPKSLADFVTKHAQANRISASDKIMGYFGHDPKMKARIDEEIKAGRDPAKSKDEDVRDAWTSATFNADLNDDATGAIFKVGRNVASKGIDDVRKGQGEGAEFNANVLEARGKTDAKEINEGEKRAAELNTSIKELAGAMNVFAERIDTGKMAKDQPVDAKNFDFPKSTQNLNEAANALKEAAATIKSLNPNLSNPGDLKQ